MNSLAQTIKDTYSKALSETVRGFMERNNVSRDRMSQDTGLSPSTITRICKGTSNPSLETIGILSAYFIEKTGRKEYSFEVEIVNNTKLVDLKTITRLKRFLIAMEEAKLQEEAILRDLELSKKG